MAQLCSSSSSPDSREIQRKMGRQTPEGTRKQLEKQDGSESSFHGVPDTGSSGGPMNQGTESGHGVQWGIQAGYQEHRQEASPFPQDAEHSEYPTRFQYPAGDPRSVLGWFGAGIWGIRT